MVDDYDRRLERLTRRSIYYESRHLFEGADRCAIAEDIAFRRHGERKQAFPPWTTIAQALTELETVGDDASDAFKLAFSQPQSVDSVSHNVRIPFLMRSAIWPICSSLIIRGGDKINVSPRARTKIPFARQWFATARAR
jgi:hypothetical protein